MFAARRATWAVPPICLVPDVDYAVGPPNDCAACVSPAVASLPAGVTFDVGLQRVDCVGAADGVVIENLDFTLLAHGGGIYVNGCNNVTIRNIKTKVDCANPFPAYPIRQASNSTGITITKVTIDNGGKASEACWGPVGELIYLEGPGAKSVTYSRAVNVTQHWLTFACATGQTCTPVEKFNSASSFGFAQGEHTNGVQFLGVFINADLSHNYYYNPQPSVADDVRQGCFGPRTCTNDNVGGTVVLVNGEMVIQSLLSNAVDYGPGMQITGSGFTGTAYICTVTDYGGPANGPDYAKLTLTTGPFVPGTGCTGSVVTTTNSIGTAQVQNAYPFGITAAIWYINQAPVPGAFLNGTISGNVFDGDGPLQGGTNAINCLGASGGYDLTGLTVTGNYIKPEGYSTGLFRSNAFCTGITGSGNKNLTTGATIAVP